MSSIFASDVHAIVPHAEHLFTLLGVPVTNSMVLGWLVSTLMVIVLIIVASKIKIKSGKRGITIIELMCEAVVNLAAEVMHDRKKALKYAPFLLTLFLFIMFNNWAGLLPGVGSIKYHNEPLLRAWTSDLTGTLALSISSIIIIQIYSFRELRLKGVLTHYFSNQPWNPINLFVGLLELLGEFTRMASLALRLFGNVFAGEVLLLVLASITGFGSPVSTLPFIIMELFVGFVQAFVFTTLVIVYLTLATSHHEEESGELSDHSSISEPSAKNLLTKGSPG
ncbi:MAG TPA: F0F1 ATP synthase subunit A [Candidatus Saccharimonadales bacterium]|nr:F0F1 ATP synthase subunit A [Candidatus Saccharimonadales bacterium]